MNADREQLREALSSYLDGELDTAAADRVRAALQSDATLREEFDALRSVSQQLQTLPRHTCPQDLSTAFANQQVDSHATASPQVLRLHHVSRWVAAAAVMALCTFAGWELKTLTLQRTASQQAQIERTVDGLEGIDDVFAKRETTTAPQIFNKDIAHALPATPTEKRAAPSATPPVPGTAGTTITRSPAPQLENQQVGELLHTDSDVARRASPQARARGTTAPQPSAAADQVLGEKLDRVAGAPPTEFRKSRFAVGGRMDETAQEAEPDAVRYQITVAPQDAEQFSRSTAMLGRVMHTPTDATWKAARAFGYEKYTGITTAGSPTTQEVVVEVATTQLGALVALLDHHAPRQVQLRDVGAARGQERQEAESTQLGSYGFGVKSPLPAAELDVVRNKMTEAKQAPATDRLSAGAVWRSRPLTPAFGQFAAQQQAFLGLYIDELLEAPFSTPLNFRGSGPTVPVLITILPPGTPTSAPAATQPTSASSPN